MVQDSGTYTQTISIKNRGGFQTFTTTFTSVPIADGEVSAILVAEIPEAPSGLTVDAQNGTVLLDWDDNTESDLAGYNIYRSTEANGVYQGMNDTLLSNSTFSDSSVGENEVYYYYITVKDTDHNESGHFAPLASGQIVYLPIVLKQVP